MICSSLRICFRTDGLASTRISCKSAMTCRESFPPYLSSHDTLSLLVKHLGHGPSVACPDISQDLQVLILDQLQSFFVYFDLPGLCFLGDTA